MTTDQNLLLPSLRRTKSETKFSASHEGGLLGNEHKLEDVAKAHEVGMILTKHYPDHIWQVMASHHHGAVWVKLPMFSDYSNVIHLKNITSPNDLEQRVLKAGGEFLEIFLQPRGAMKEDQFKDSFAKMKRFGAGAGKINPNDLDADLNAEAYVAGKLRELGIGVEGV